MIGVTCGLAVAAAVQAATMPWTTKAMRVQASTSTEPEDILKFTFEFSNHPTSITLSVNYSAPANTNAALYDSGDGVWRTFTSRVIPILASSNYVAFKGDWRKSGGVYSYMFSTVFFPTNARCRSSGRLAYAPTNNANAYYAVFDTCTRITSFDDNPFQPITGSPGTNMFQYAFRNMNGVTNLPAGFLNTSGLTGAPAANMFNSACNGMSGVTNLPSGFLDTSGLTGAPAANMLDRSLNGMSGLIAGDFNLSSNITFATNNIASSMPSAFAGMTKWTGTVYWGASRIYDAITNPASDANVFLNSTNVPGYTTMGANWK
jgi:hypothetical protein